jgi:hypothetical protein
MLCYVSASNLSLKTFFATEPNKIEAAAAGRGVTSVVTDSNHCTRAPLMSCYGPETATFWPWSMIRARGGGKLDKLCFVLIHIVAESKALVELFSKMAFEINFGRDDLLSYATCFLGGV